MGLFSIFLFIFIAILILLYMLLHFTPILQKLRQCLKLSGHGPPAYPVIGCLFSFYQNYDRLLAWYTDLLIESPTQTINIRRPGATTTIVTVNPKNVEYMLNTNFINNPKGMWFTEILGEFLGCGIFNVDGELWHMQRKLVSLEFCIKALREYMVKTMKEGVEAKLFPALETLTKEEAINVVDFQELFRILGFDMVCKVLLGFDLYCLDNYLADVSPLLTAFDVASEIGAKRGAESISV